MGQASSVSSPLQCALPVPLARLPPSFKDADQRDQWAAKEVDRRRRQQRHEDQEEKARRADDAKADRNDEGEGDDGADANSAAGGAAGGSGPDPGCSCVRQQHAMRKLVRMGAEAAVVAPAEGGVDAGPSELVLAFQSLAPLLRSLELRPAATVTSVSASSSVAAAAAVAAADPILPRVDTPLPRSSGGLESFRRQTAEGAAGRSESESQSQCQSQSQSQLQSARVCALLLSCASELAELERLDWTLPLPAAALFAPPPTAAHSAAATGSGSVATGAAADQPTFDLRCLTACARLVHLHLRWPRADSNAADADPSSASGSSPDSATAAAAAVLDAQLRELQIALPALRIVQTKT